MPLRTIDLDEAVFPAVPGSSHRRSRRRSRARQRVLRFARFVAVPAAAVAAFAGGQPTGTQWWDMVLQAAVGALFVLASRRLPDGFMIVAATVAAVATAGSIWVLAAAAGLVLAIASTALAQRHPRLKVLSGAFTVQALLRIPAIGFFGLPSLIAGAIFVVGLAIWYERSRRSDRRVVRRTAVLAAVAAVAILLVGAVMLLGAKRDVDRGIAAARAGLSAARGGDPAAVVGNLERASEALDDAEATANGLLTQPMRLLPIVAQHHRAITVATEQGGAIARQASRATVEADITSISMDAGSIDLAALADMEGDLADTVELLDRGLGALDDVRSPWLLPTLDDRLGELTDELRVVLPEARIAADAARVVPGLLGQDGPRRYLVLFGSPAESREFGGFVGSWAVLQVDAGAVSQVDAGRTQDLYDLTRSQPALAVPEYPLWYVERARPALWPQNITGTVDIATMAAAARSLLAPPAAGSSATGGSGSGDAARSDASDAGGAGGGGAAGSGAAGVGAGAGGAAGSDAGGVGAGGVGAGGVDVDGVVYLDAYALQAILELTGPIRIDGVDHPINGRNAAEFLLVEQYGLDNREELKSEAGRIFTQAFASLTDTVLPGPERLGAVLGPAARQGRLQVATFVDDENDFLQSVKLQRPFAGGTAAVDSFAVVQTNALQNKLDAYLQRDITYDVAVDADGSLTGTATVVLTSNVPDDVAPYALGEVLPGTSRLYLSLYTPHAVSSARIGGDPAEVAFVNEFGYTRNEVTVEIPAGESRTVRFDFAGRINPSDLSVLPDASQEYSVAAWYQPLVNDDTVEVTVRDPRGATRTTGRVDLTESTILTPR